MAVEASRKLTYADYAALPDDGRRWEIVDGEAYVNPAPNVRHQRIVGRLFMALATHVEQHGGGEAFVSPFDVVMSDHDIVQPDVLYLADADAHQLTEPNLQGRPTLAIEVLSDPRHDRVPKRQLYARFGVPEYWIVDPVARSAEVYRLAAGGTYPEPELYEPGDQLTTPLLPGLVIDVATLLSE